MVERWIQATHPTFEQLIAQCEGDLQHESVGSAESLRGPCACTGTKGRRLRCGIHVFAVNSLTNRAIHSFNHDIR
jgi:hypothetical protein